MRKGWGKENQSEALETITNFLSNANIESLDKSDTLYKDWSFGEILDFLASDKFVPSDTKVKKEIFTEVSNRVCKILNIPRADITIKPYRFGSYLYGNSGVSGDVTLYCDFNKDEVLPKKINEVGLNTLGYLFHELRHSYQYQDIKILLNKIDKGEHIKGTADKISNAILNLVAFSYEEMRAKIDTFYNFNSTEIDANFFAFRMLKALAKEYPKYSDTLSNVIVDMTGDYFLNASTDKGDVTDYEVKVVEYYINNFLKDFTCNEMFLYVELLDSFDAEKLKKIREKQKKEVRTFVKDYTKKKLNDISNKMELIESQKYLLINKDKFSDYEKIMAMRLLEAYDYDINKADTDIKNKYFGAVESVLKKESYVPVNLKTNIDDTKIHYRY